MECEWGLGDQDDEEKWDTIWAWKDETGDKLVGQPRAVFEVLLLLSAEQRDWALVTSVLREMGTRRVSLRSAVTAALFTYVDTAQHAVALFETLKRENVKVHLHAYYAMMAALQRIEEEEEAATLLSRWDDSGTVTGDMMDFIVAGTDEQLFPETNPLVAKVNGRDPRKDVSAALDGLLRKDRAVLHTAGPPAVGVPDGPQVLHRVSYR